MPDCEAWVLRPGEGPLSLETIALPEPGEDELLVEPILGAWEGNMSHALRRSPVDICRQRGEGKVVLGNSGVVRVLRPGSSGLGFREGDLCLLFCNSEPDAHGLPGRIFAYDAPGTVGLLAKRTLVKARQLIAIPERSRLSLAQWAAFSLRYVTAWANWKLASGCWALLSRGNGPAPAHVWGWGGGVAFAELQLAAMSGCRAAMAGSSDERLGRIAAAGFAPVDRRSFPDLSLDEDRYAADPDYRERYRSSERAFLDEAERITGGAGVSIFVDYIGSPVVRATLKALGRPGVLTTAGWKGGMKIASLRAIECMNWHVHVHTHYARYEDGLAAVAFAEETGWAPDPPSRISGWEGVPALADDYESSRTNDYFPLYRVNPE